MVKLIITENQLIKLMDNFIVEDKLGPIDEYISTKSQIYAEHYGSATKKPVSHKLLENNFGLPSGTTYENYYYSANLSDVVNASKTMKRNKFLSIFRPISPYSKNKNDYSDIFTINNKTITNEGKKTFNLSENGVIYATHNGLLSLTRAMNNMKGELGYLTIELNANEERGYNIIFDLNSSINPKSIFKGIQNIYVKFVINPDFYEKMKIDFTNKKSPQEIKQLNIVENLIVNFITGVSSYLQMTDDNFKNNIINNLSSKGMINKIDFDINSFLNELTSLSKENDYIDNKTINPTKKRKISDIGKKYQTEILNKMKDAYIHNLKLFVITYLPNHAKSIIPKLTNLDFTMDDLGEVYERIFTSYGIESNIKNSKGQIDALRYKEGK